MAKSKKLLEREAKQTSKLTLPKFETDIKGTHVDDIVKPLVKGVKASAEQIKKKTKPVVEKAAKKVKKVVKHVVKQVKKTKSGKSAAKWTKSYPGMLDR